MASRMSVIWSEGGTGKYPPLKGVLYPLLPPSSLRPVFQAASLESMA